MKSSTSELGLIARMAAQIINFARIRPRFYLEIVQKISWALGRLGRLQRAASLAQWSGVDVHSDINIDKSFTFSIQANMVTFTLLFEIPTATVFYKNIFHSSITHCITFIVC